MSNAENIWKNAPFLRTIIDDACRCLAVDRIVLFGSRARGDATASSDFDLAFEHQSTDVQWCDFVNRIQDEANTLHDLDLVDARQMSLEMRARMHREGVVLYG